MSFLKALSLRPSASNSLRPKPRTRAESHQRLKAVEAQLEVALAEHKTAMDDNAEATERAKKALLDSVRPASNA